ncbi:UNVERIFIED_CONTAM: hypothetical protein RMT77_018368 [Armadillidium vulgare]
MQEIMFCDSCLGLFDILKFIPKILDCGHTFCSTCLTIIIRKNSICPNCKTEIKVKESSIPVNFIALKVVDVYLPRNSSASEREKKIIASIENTKKKFNDRNEIISMKKSRISSSLKVLDKLEELMVSQGQKFNTVNAKNMLNELDEELKKTYDVVSYDYVKSSASILLSNFEDSASYLMEIHKRVQNKENVFAVYKIKDEIKYGETSLFENKLFFHSLSLTEVPKDSSLIWFDELKQCANKENFYTFLSICCNENNVSLVLIIEMFDRQLSHHFIKLCTGESGPSYKGTSFQKGEDDDDSKSILVTDFMENGCKNSMWIDYNFSDKDGIECIKDEIYLCILDQEVGFQIFLSSVDFVAEKTVGRVISPLDLKNCINYHHSSFLKILNCGIILEA